VVYNTSCFGASHADNLIGAGFKAAAGAAKVNANSPTEYPAVLAMWAAGASFSTAITTGDNPSTRKHLDAIAKQAKFSPVDSQKSVQGNGSLTINYI
jgi:hypothetical protein